VVPESPTRTPAASSRAQCFRLREEPACRTDRTRNAPAITESIPPMIHHDGSTPVAASSPAPPLLNAKPPPGNRCTSLPPLVVIQSRQHMTSRCGYRVGQRCVFAKTIIVRVAVCANRRACPLSGRQDHSTVRYVPRGISAISGHEFATDIVRNSGDDGIPSPCVTASTARTHWKGDALNAGYCEWETAQGGVRFWTWFRRRLAWGCAYSLYIYTFRRIGSVVRRRSFE